MWKRTFFFLITLGYSAPPPCMALVVRVRGHLHGVLWCYKCLDSPLAMPLVSTCGCGPNILESREQHFDTSRAKLLDLKGETLSDSILLGPSMLRALPPPPPTLAHCPLEWSHWKRPFHFCVKRTAIFLSALIVQRQKCQPSTFSFFFPTWQCQGKRTPFSQGSGSTEGKTLLTR